MSMESPENWRDEALGVAGWRSAADPNQLCLEEVALLLSSCANAGGLEIELVWQTVLTGFDVTRIERIAATGDWSIGDVLLTFYRHQPRLVYEPRAYRGYAEVRSEESDPDGDYPVDLTGHSQDKRDVGDDPASSNEPIWFGAGTGAISLPVPWMRATAVYVSGGGHMKAVLEGYSRLLRTVSVDVWPTPTLSRLSASSALLMSPVRTRLEHCLLAGRVPRETHALLHYYHRPTRIPVTRFKDSARWLALKVATSEECSQLLADWLTSWSV